MTTTSIFKHFLDILESMPDGIFISDVQGNALFVNRMYEQITGLKGSDFIGVNVRTLVNNGTYDKVVNPEVVQTKQPQTHVQKLKNGKRIILSGMPVFDSEGELCLVVTFARDITRLSTLNDQMEEQKKLINHFHDQMRLISQQGIHDAEKVFISEPIKKIKDTLERISKTDATILILGETGVGKDVFAKYTHSKSHRKDAIFFKVDCGVISETLIESEMFGYVSGAFTGASTKGKAGFFELADGGTIFLDEVGELPLSTQTRLLRVLQDGEIMRLGDNRSRKVDVRIIAATNKNLADCVHDGSFRSDLYYRLNVATVKIPPLRDREADIEPIAKHYLHLYASKYIKNITFMESTLELLKKYTWPGNIRELQNMVHSIVISSNSHLITPNDLPAHFRSLTPNTKDYAENIKGTGKSFKEIMQVLEKEFLQEAIEYHGSIQKVAKVFQIDRSTIFRKLNS